MLRSTVLAFVRKTPAHQAGAVLIRWEPEQAIERDLGEDVAAASGAQAVMPLERVEEALFVLADEALVDHHPRWTVGRRSRFFVGDGAAT